MNVKTLMMTIVALLATMILLAGRQGEGEETHTPTPASSDIEIVEVLVCPLPDGTGVFTATHVLGSAAGWYVMDIVTATLSNGADVITIAGPLQISPGVCEKQ